MTNNPHHSPNQPHSGWGYGDTGQPGYGKPFQRPFSHPETQPPAFAPAPYQRSNQRPNQLPYTPPPGYPNPYGQPSQPGQPLQPGQPGPFGPAGQQPAPFGQQPGSGVSPVRAKRRMQRRTGLRFVALYAVVIWAVYIINEVVFGGNLLYFGIHPLEPSSLPFIFTSPLLHANLEHILGNTISGAVFAFLVGYSGKRVFWEVTAFVVVIGGIGTWLFGGIGTNHIGASGLVYGWWAYLLVRGFFNRSGAQIGLGVVLFFYYSGLVYGMFPMEAGVSWQAHLFGAIGGVIAAMIITSDDPPELVARREQKQLEKRMSRSQFGN